MADKISDWKMWAIGAMFTVIMSVTGVVCNTVTTRFEKVEAAQETTVQEAKNAAIQAAVVKEVVRELTVSLDKLDAKQTVLVDRLDTLLSGVARDSRRWNAEMDRLDRTRKK